MGVKSDRPSTTVAAGVQKSLADPQNAAGPQIDEEMELLEVEKLARLLPALAEGKSQLEIILEAITYIQRLQEDLVKGDQEEVVVNAQASVRDKQEQPH